MDLKEIHESKNSIYLVLELLEGGELFSYISSKKQLSLASVKNIMKCLLSSLDYLAK
jgi:serine/threonine protein kinase